MMVFAAAYLLNSSSFSLHHTPAHATCHERDQVQAGFKPLYHGSEVVAMVLDVRCRWPLLLLSTLLLGLMADPTP